MLQKINKIQTINLVYNQLKNLVLIIQFQAVKVIIVPIIKIVQSREASQILQQKM
jgi:hypothetical protein